MATGRLLGLFPVLLICGEVIAQPPPQPPSSYFTVVQGNVPILITAGHGGTLSYPFPPRPCTGTQTCERDTNTRLVAPRMSDEFFALTGLRPYMIVAQGERKFIDLNRDKTAIPNDAFDDPLAEPYYDYYHDTIQGFIDEIRQQFGRGLLLDIHGQSTLPGLMVRGTKNGLTTTELRDTFGSDPSMNGVNSIFGSLQVLGYPADPNVNVPFASQVENPSYDGGYTVQAYGSHQATGMDSIQIEIGIDFRGGSGATEWQQTSDDLAIAMKNFYEAYLAQVPGDVDRNGQVEGLDFLSLQRGLGTPLGATLSDGDTNGDGKVDGADIPIWENNYGTLASVVAPITAVPEPGTLTSLVCGLFFFVLGRRQRNRVEHHHAAYARRIGSAAAIGTVMLATATLATHAEILTFTNQGTWEAALNAPSILEDFEGASNDVLFGLAYQPTESPNGDLGLRANANFANNASIDVLPYLSAGAGIGGNTVVNMRFLDQGNSTNSQETVDVFLPTGISAFAFQYNNYDNGGDGTFLSFSGTNGQEVTAFDSAAVSFFGVVDTEPGATILSFSFTGDPTTGTGTSAFNSFDNVRYGVASAAIVAARHVPEPSGAALAFVLGIGILSVRICRCLRPVKSPGPFRGVTIKIQFDNNVRPVAL